MPNPSLPADSSNILGRLGFDLQVKTLSFLRANDLSAVHQINRYFWQAKRLQHAIVVYCASQVYPPQWTQGFEHQPTSRSTAVVVTPRKTRTSSLGSASDEAVLRKQRSSSVGSDSDKSASPVYYTFEHLRNMELLVVARLLNSPEPTTGFVVSKHWCKAALAWLEGKQSEPVVAKKKTKKAKKKRSLLPPPHPNVNSDITCEHDQLQHMTSSRSARARRRLLDKKAWKTLKALFPESTTLPACTGECMQCRLEIVQAHKEKADALETAKRLRKEPLQDPIIRRFYTRTKGVPEQCLRNNIVGAECPLMDGTYYVLPRSWCHGWRRFMKTGEGGKSETSYEAPDSARVLCDLHRMALLPPHLEDFLHGRSSHLLESSTQRYASSAAAAVAHMPESSLPPLQAPAEESLGAMRSLGLSEEEISRQLAAMRTIEARRRRLEETIAAEAAGSLSRNEMLDRENYIVVEILSQEEFLRLERSGTFGLKFRVSSGRVQFDTPICRSCDTSGRQCSVSILNRSRAWNKKSTDKSRATASLEY